MSVTETLIAARNMILHEDHWNQGSQGISKINKYGSEVYTRCALGALRAVGGTVEDHDKAINILAGLAVITKADPYNTSIIMRNAPNFKVAAYNNTHTHQEVIAWFNEAIKVSSQTREA